MKQHTGNMNNLWWIQQEAARRYSSAEAEFRNAYDIWQRVAGSGRTMDIRQAAQRVMFAAQHLLQQSREMQTAGLSGNAALEHQARNFLQPGAEIQRNRNRGDWSR